MEMIERRAIVGLALLSALLFSALAAQSTLAAAHTSENTTAFTCVKGGGSLDFADEHCDQTVSSGTGSFGHEVIPGGLTEIELTNAKTANNTTEASLATIKTKAFGVEVHIDCKTVSGTGSIGNSGSGFDHKVEAGLAFGLSSCTVTKPTNCTVDEPIAIAATLMGVDQLNGAEKNMGLEFEPLVSDFTTITFRGIKCALKDKTFPLTGAMISTGLPAGNARESGATWVFSPEKAMQSLKLGVEPAEFLATLTVRMKGGGNPISLTTTT